MSQSSIILSQSNTVGGTVAKAFGPSPRPVLGPGARKATKPMKQPPQPTISSRWIIVDRLSCFRALVQRTKFPCAFDRHNE